VEKMYVNKNHTAIVGRCSLGGTEILIRTYTKGCDLGR